MNFVISVWGIVIGIIAVHSMNGSLRKDGEITELRRQRDDLFNGIQNVVFDIDEDCVEVSRMIEVCEDLKKEKRDD